MLNHLERQRRKNREERGREEAQKRMATESVMMLLLENNKFALLVSTGEGLSPKVLMLHNLHNAFGCFVYCVLPEVLKWMGGNY